mgnify:CR=1 FL=1
MSTRSKTILLVEDNPKDKALTLRALKKQAVDVNVVVARDGVEALDYLSGSAEQSAPQLVLLDLKLPKIDGLEVLRRMRAQPRTHFVPVVILTSSTEDEDLLAGYALGANSYIRKPVDYNQFAEAVRQLGLYWMALNNPAPSG